jgi:hypothetical protein
MRVILIPVERTLKSPDDKGRSGRNDIDFGLPVLNRELDGYP